MSQVPSVDWFCELCREFGNQGIESAECAFCGLPGGILRQTNLRTSVVRLKKFNSRLYNSKGQKKRFIKRTTEELHCETDSIKHNQVSDSEPSSIRHKLNSHSMMIVEDNCNPLKIKLIKINKNSSEILKFNETEIIESNQNPKDTFCKEESDEISPERVIQTQKSNGIQSQKITKIKIAQNEQSKTTPGVCLFYDFYPKMKQIHQRFPLNIHFDNSQKQPYVWIHNTCLLSNDNLQFDLTSTPLQILNFYLFKFQANLLCQLCKRDEGVVIKCKDEDCKEHFHSECARRSDFDIQIDLFDSHTLQIRCPSHKNKSRNEAIAKNRKIKQAIFENLITKLKQIAGKVVVESTDHKKIEDFVANKTTISNNKPVKKRGRPPKDKTNSTKGDFGKADLSILSNSLNKRDFLFLQSYKKIIFFEKPELGFTISLKRESKSKFSVVSVNVPSTSLFETKPFRVRNWEGVAILGSEKNYFHLIREFSRIQTQLISMQEQQFDSLKKKKKKSKEMRDDLQGSCEESKSLAHVPNKVETDYQQMLGLGIKSASQGNNLNRDFDYRFESKEETSRLDDCIVNAQALSLTEFKHIGTETLKQSQISRSGDPVPFKSRSFLNKTNDKHEEEQGKCAPNSKVSEFKSGEIEIQPETLGNEQ